jgi:hypothetical protein
MYNGICFVSVSVNVVDVSSFITRCSYLLAGRGGGPMVPAIAVQVRETCDWSCIPMTTLSGIRQMPFCKTTGAHSDLEVTTGMLFPLHARPNSASVGVGGMTLAGLTNGKGA